MKKRLDILVYEKGFTDSREKAKAIIMSGQVYVDNQKADKCGTSYDENVKIEVRGNTQKYVSRGGLKLEKAIDNFDFDLKDKITMDLPTVCYKTVQKRCIQLMSVTVSLLGSFATILVLSILNAPI